MVNSRFLSLCGIWALILCGGFFCNNVWMASCLDGNTNCSESTTLSITLSNSYTWLIQFNSGTNDRIISGWNIWIGQQTGMIHTIASESSTFILQWWLYNLTWWWFGSYNLIHPYNLGPEWIHTLQAEYSRSWEFLFSNILTLYTDYSAPSIPLHTWMPDNTIFTSTTGSLSRSNAVDTGVGLAWYYLYISMNPSFAWITPIRVTGNNREFNTNDLPRWTVFYKTVAVDYLNHESSSATSYFHNQVPTNISNGWNSYSTVPLTTDTKNTDEQPYIIDTHPVAHHNLIKRKIFNNQTKALKPYLINNFNEHGITNWILPDVMPETGVWADDLEPITKDMIEEQLQQDFMYTNSPYCVYFYLFRLLIIFILIDKRNVRIKIIKKYTK